MHKYERDIRDKLLFGFSLQPFEAQEVLNLLEILDHERKQLRSAVSTLQKIGTPVSMLIPADEEDHECELQSFWHRASYSRLNLAEDTLKVLIPEGDCCERETREMAGGCTNCGDPCL